VPEDIFGEHLGVGERQDTAGGGAEDLRGHVEHPGTCWAAERAEEPRSRQRGWKVSGSRQNMDCEDLRAGSSGLARRCRICRRLLLGQVVGIERQCLPAVVAGQSAHLPQGDLQVLGPGHGALGQQVVDRLVGDQEGQAVGQFQALLGERAVLGACG